jgi:hypothetical protein
LELPTERKAVLALMRDMAPATQRQNGAGWTMAGTVAQVVDD